MNAVKLAIVFYSTYGTNHRMAEIAAEAAGEAGAEVRLRRVKETAPAEVVKTQDAWRAQVEKTVDIPEATPDDLVWADAYLFSSPTRYGGAASQMRAFIDTLGPIWTEGKLANKLVSAMSSAQNPHGGQESTVLSLYTTFMHWGAIIVPTGYTDQSIFAAGGNPYGTTVSAGGEGITDAVAEAIRHQTRRLVEVARKFVR
jgi:NAD(P)H dehydrogenase (quinone)